MANVGPLFPRGPEPRPPYLWPRAFMHPLSYTPGSLAEKILSSKSALEGERKQVNVLLPT